MRALTIIVIAAVSVLGNQPAHADRQGRGLQLETPYLAPDRESRDRSEDRNRDRNQQRGTGLSPNEAARRAQRENGGGRVLSVDAAGSGFRVKLLRDGEVRVIYVE